MSILAIVFLTAITNVQSDPQPPPWLTTTARTRPTWWPVTTTEKTTLRPGVPPKVALYHHIILESELTYCSGLAYYAFVITSASCHWSHGPKKQYIKHHLLSGFLSHEGISEHNGFIHSHPDYKAGYGKTLPRNDVSIADAKTGNPNPGYQTLIDVVPPPGPNMPWKYYITLSNKNRKYSYSDQVFSLFDDVACGFFCKVEQLEFDPATMLCGVIKNSALCPSKNDLGTPLYYEPEYNVRKIMGVLSHYAGDFDKCGQGGLKPLIFTRLFRYMDFIQGEIESHQG